MVNYLVLVSIQTFPDKILSNSIVVKTTPLNLLVVQIAHLRHSCYENKIVQKNQDGILYQFLVSKGILPKRKCSTTISI